MSKSDSTFSDARLVTKIILLLRIRRFAMRLATLAWSIVTGLSLLLTVAATTEPLSADCSNTYAIAGNYALSSCIGTPNGVFCTNERTDDTCGSTISDTDCIPQTDGSPRIYLYYCDGNPGSDCVEDATHYVSQYGTFARTQTVGCAPP